LVFNGAISGGTTTQGITLSLIGANTNANAVNGNITNGGAAGGVGVLKQGAGNWMLSSSNSYSGGTSVTAGTLSITGSYSGTGTYQMGGGTLNINTAGTVTPANINFNAASAVTLSAGTVQTAAVNSLGAGASNGRFLNLNGGTL